MRLQRFLSQCGVASRRRSESLIQSGRVLVNGERVVELGIKIDTASDTVSVDGKVISVEAKKLFLFHKPVGVTTTMRDPHAKKTIADFVKNVAVRVVPVGRLDVDASGLLLLTNDGDYAHQLQHPRFEVRRRYLALVKGKPSKAALSELRTGVMLEDGMGKALKASLLKEQEIFKNVSENQTVVSLEVGEGRKHFVKNLLAGVGHPVQKLCRVAYGPYELGNLAPGQLFEINTPKPLS